MKLSSEQQMAVEMCCDLMQPIVGVTGAAGTGKTSVLGEAVRELRSKGVTYALAAPTGRAAQRIQELTGIPANTVHRLLQYPMPDDDYDDDHPINTPRRNKFNPLDDRVTFVDESSMLDNELFYHLLDALPVGGCIRFFGDNNQLPPVEDSRDPPFKHVLNDYPSMCLTYNYRAGHDDLISNALRVLQGRVPIKTPRFQVIYCERPIDAMVHMATKDFMEANYQIIIPYRQRNHGTIRVNPALQAKFNPDGPLLRLPRFDDKDSALAVRPQDKFIWIKNDYELGMFNGEIGRIDWLCDSDGSLGLVTDRRSITVPPRISVYSSFHHRRIQYDPRKQVELGYAITTHKAQGSEFDYVIYCMCSAHAFMLNRRNFYTAVTRAKKQVIVICDRKSMGLSIGKKGD